MRMMTLSNIRANSSNTNVVDVSVSGSEVTLTPTGVGSTIVSVEANDNELIATQIISVSVSPASVVSEADWMPDANLRAVVRTRLGLQEGAALTKEAMLRLTVLVPSNKGVKDITGLEFATNLTNLTSFGNQISVINALSNLTSLTYLHLANNQIRDVTPLENLTSLTYLYLTGNPITDLTPLRRLKANNPNVQLILILVSLPNPLKLSPRSLGCQMRIYVRKCVQDSVYSQTNPHTGSCSRFRLVECQ